MYNFIIMMDNEISIQSTQNKIDSNDNLQSSDKVQNRDWLHTLPYPRIISGDGRFSFGNIVQMNSDKWHGIYKPQKSEYEDGFLTLEPFINKNIFSLSPNTFVDTRIAQIDESGKITPKLEEGWKILLPLLPEWENSEKYHALVRPKEGEIPESKDGVPLIFRGIDYKLMRKFIINGKTRSGEVEQGLIQLDLEHQLFFADNPEPAFNYSAWGSGFTQPSFEQPSYVISIKMPDSENITLRPEEHEVILNTYEGINLEDVTHIYEIRPYKIISSMSIPLRISHGEKAMRMEEGVGNIFLAPKTFSVYREVKVEDIQ